MRLALLWLLTTLLAFSEPRVVNLGPGFREFATRARGQSPERQNELWTELVESQFPELYSDLIWQGSWADRRDEILRARLPGLLARAESLEKAFEVFPSQIQVQSERFRNALPDAELDLPVVVAPAFRFNGRAADLPQAGFLLAIGLDEVERRGDNVDVLFSHELFHVYHCRKIGVTNELIARSSPLLPLWLEGLAVYFSMRQNPQVPLEEVLMDTSLPNISEQDMTWLASHFPREGSPPPEWFQSGFRVRPDLPERCAYALGLRVAEKLGEQYSLAEMVNWQEPEIQRRVGRALDEWRVVPTKATR